MSAPKPGRFSPAVRGHLQRAVSVTKSVATTLQSYATAGAGASARQQKVLTVLAGGKRGDESAA
jgi:hypothetical protein